ncbi:septal ring lytic transglycosylase RlpA family protein [Streptomyces olivaceus]|uniref:septal ring lytic transglycosylase RlpA family protein n=1 Tax=Streptomyces olivaceus TaxID=47716 RepID=UPI001CCBD17D|nr:septal ring lytic transglycosylase RlpA family protein [Streptomyces olivaceus]MBZ6081385.1 septal ring lytic transglycosylase RlpA family protein [Streptomyces olivaceus]
MSRRRTLGTKKKLALLAGAAAVAGGGAFAAANASNAAQTAPGAQTRAAGDSTVCQGLATALGNNLRFIDGQRAEPDAQSEARIANREAVVAEIERKQEASGCAAGESAPAPGSAPPPQSPPASQPAQTSQPPQAGEQVCTGSTVALSGEGGAPAASSNQFPVGTTLRVTNLDNGKSTTVTVDSVSGSCALLNDAAFEEVREDGKFLIRRALIEKVG